MEPIDAAFERFRRLLAEIAAYDASIFSEQDTRVKVLDRLFLEVLGWNYADLSTEVRAGSGFVDYQFSRDGRARLVLEAKRDGSDFGLAGRPPGRSYKLNGPVFSSKELKAGIEQAITYCAFKNAELACVSNGREFVIFRGSRLGDGKDTLDGMGFVFSSHAAIESEFKRFYDLLAPDPVGAFEYRAHFQEAEGRPIRATSFQKTLRLPSSRQLVRQDELGNDIDRVMTSFFRRLSGDDDPDLLVQCFVPTKQSQHADNRLARISEDLVLRIRTLETESADELTRLLETAHSRQGHEFVVLIGTKGSGKTTFIDRFFKYVLPKHLAKEAVVARINVGESDGNDAQITSWLDQRLLDVLEATVFGADGPSFEDIQGMFFDEYTRRSKGTLKHLYDSDKQAFKVDFGRHIESRRETRPHEYIERLLHHIVRSRRKIPCLIFDNADHFTIEFQEKVFQFARSLYEKAMCLVILPITDRTSWQLSREGALKSFEIEALYLPTPSPRAIIASRIKYLQEKLDDEQGRDQAQYFVGRGIRLSISNLRAFVSTLQHIFLNTGRASQTIGNLANYDIRRCLEIARQVVASPHVGATELLKAHVMGSAITVPEWRLTHGLLRGRYDIHAEGEHDFAFNLYNLTPEADASPLLATRILQALLDVKAANPDDPFITVDQVCSYCGAMLVDARTSMMWLRRLLELGLVQSYDPTVKEIAQVAKIQITPSGFQHLQWSLKNKDYVQVMRDVTPIRDVDVYERLEALRSRPRKEVWWQELRVFAEYLVAEDSRWIAIPSHESHKSQRSVAAKVTATGAARQNASLELPN